jgi:DNA repair protein RadA/Sms
MGSTAKVANDTVNTAVPYLKVNGTGVKHGTNIMQVRVPSQLERTVQTGIEWFDESCGGKESPGLTPSTLGLITGVPGGGKTTLALQIADSCMQQGHIALYNTGEESLFQVRKTVKRLGLKDGFICGEDAYLKDILTHANKLRSKYPNRQLFMVLDSLKTINDGFYRDGAMNGNTPGRVIKKLVEFCKETFTIVIVIGHVTKDGKFAGKQEIIHDLDVHGHIRFDTNPKSDTFGMRIFNQSKNRFGPLNLTGTVLDLNNGGLCKAGTFEVDDLDDE